MGFLGFRNHFRVVVLGPWKVFMNRYLYRSHKEKIAKSLPKKNYLDLNGAPVWGVDKAPMKLLSYLGSGEF